MSPEHRSRVLQSIAETHRMLDRAMGYSPKFRDMALIAFCEAHLVKLNTMLES